MLPGLTINHPLTIIGTPATVLEIVNGNILVDFRKYRIANDVGTNDERMKFVIKETTIVF